MKRSKTSASDGFASAFGAALDKHLAARSMRRADLAVNLDVSAAYISRVAAGTANVSPSAVNRFAEALALDAGATASLMVAAAQAKGYLSPDLTCPHCGKKYGEPKQ